MPVKTQPQRPPAIAPARRQESMALPGQPWFTEGGGHKGQESRRWDFWGTFGGW